MSARRSGMRCSYALILAAATSLGACVNEAAELGQPPPVELAVARRTLPLALLEGQARTQAALRAALSALGGDGLGVRAYIQAAAAQDADAVRGALVGMNVDPARITIALSADAQRSMPVVTLTRSFAVTTDCNAAVAPAFRDDPTASLESIGDCVQADNLAAMLVDPGDLIKPPALAPADGAYLAAGVQAWRANRPAALQGSSTSGSDSSSSGGSYGGAGTAAATSGTSGGTGTGTSTLGTAAPAAATGNPLLEP